MKKLLLISSLCIVLFPSCTRIGVGNVGLKINQSGNNRGVNPTEYVSGWVFYNPFASDVVEFPTYMQHVEYGEFNINAHGGSQFDIIPFINYVVDPSKASDIYKEFKTTNLDDISTQYIRNAVYQSFTDITGNYTPDELLRNREKYEKSVYDNLAISLKKKGFILQQVTSNLKPPASLIASIDAKNKAEQDAQAVQLQVATSIAQANKDIAQAKGDSASMVISAAGEARANNLRQSTLTDNLLRQQMLSKWDGKLPVYGVVPTMFKDVR